MTETNLITEDQSHTGQELRERSWDLLNAAGLDYSPKYITLKDEFNKAAPIDGLIRTTRGYYRLAEDMRDGTRVLLHSYERDQLTGVEKNGKVMLGDDATDVYGIAARQSKRGPLFRYLMERDVWELSNIFQQDLNLHAEEMMIPSETPGMPDRRKIKLANKLVAYGIVETDEGKWKVRFYNNLRSKWSDNAGFTITSSESNGAFTPYSYLLDKDNNVKEYDSLSEAVKDVRKRWKIESLKVFRGENLISNNSLSKVEKTRNNVLAWWMQINDKKIVRDWTRALSVGVAVGIVSTIVTGTPVAGAIMGAGSIFGWGFISKSLETATASFQSWLLKNADEKKEQSTMLKEDIEHINDYLLKDDYSGNRNRKKLSEESYKHLRLLSIEEADMIHDDRIAAPPDNDLRDYERLTTASHRYFGAQFDATYDDLEDGIIVATYPNGLVSLTHVEKDTRATRHYLMYNKDLNLFGEGEAFKHLDPELTQLPAKGEVHKITHRQGRDFRYTPMSCDEFMSDLSAKLGKNAQDLTAFGMPLRDLFNCHACHGIHPQEKPALPVEQWRPRPKSNDNDPDLPPSAMELV